MIQYLKAENAYADTVMAPTKPFQEKLYKEMRSRIKEDDQSVPVFINGYYYYSRTETGKQYAINCRKKGSLSAAEEVTLDGNVLAEGHEAFILAGIQMSEDQNLLAFQSNTTGSYAEFTLKIKDLRTGQILPDEIEDISGFVWGTDNKTIYYLRYDEALRPYRLYRHTLGSKIKDVLLYEEKDALFTLGVGRSKSKEFIILSSGSYTTSEVQLLPTSQPEGKFEVFMPRQKDVMYNVDVHPQHFYLTYKDKQNLNQKIYELPRKDYTDRKNWKEIVPHDPKVKIEDTDVYENYLVIEVRNEGLLEMRIRELTSGATKSIQFPEPVYSAFSMGLPDFKSTKIRYGYTSLNRPMSTFEYDMTNGATTKLKEKEVPGGFDAEAYEVKRLWATAPDGVKVPMAVVHKKGLELDGKNPVLMTGYGSYGYSSDAYFDSDVFSLVDRGFVYAIAQIRGGSDLGEQWYEDGKLQKKMNSFTDFIACAEYLIREKYTASDRFAIQGGSAGGLLMGAVVNLRPELFRVVIAEVPFVDVINTMLDTSLPLTTQEYEQWGNPTVKADYDYIRQYSPYDNLKAQAYPNILATGGLNDSQVGFHEPAKWVAKLRTLKTDQNLTLLKINMGSGHGGATGRFDYLKEVAFQYAFILDRIGWPLQ
ncbi:S9 family peptidase [Siphonobacter sp. BAB-5385]|uniref:S9 family peptidase n=1 Tax=Siphonobacter sp. BAB-5385 TaxID=1864822 RepID=UPI0020CC4ABA|nr:S9 family peptidase [Siphonobacter sp. BAB-5385]